MNTWKKNLEETKQRYINWWNHKGIILNMWEHFQEGVTPHADIPMPPAPKDLNQKWFDPQWRADYLDWYVSHSSLMADMLPVANTQLGPGSLAAILGGVFEGGEDTIWIHPDPNYTDDIVFNPNHPNYLLHKELLKACKQKAQGHYYVGMPDLMEGLDVLAAIKGTDKVLLDTVMQPEVLEHQMQQINDIYFKVFDELYDIIREGDEMAFCYFSSWAPGKMSKLQSDISTMISVDDYRRFVQPFIREQCQKIDYTLYHLDGVGAMHHLDALLEIKELNAIQWTPGVGEPQGGSSKWYDLYKKILAGGKSIMACWVTLDELKPLLDNIGGDGVHLEMDFHNEREVEQALRIIEEYQSHDSVDDEVNEIIRLIESIPTDQHGTKVSLYPNAGMPDASGHYSKTPESLVADIWSLLENHCLNIIGGCCGTTDAHIRLMAKAVEPIPGLFLSPLIPGDGSIISRESVITSNSSNPEITSNSGNEVSPSERLFQAILDGKSDDAIAATQGAIAQNIAPQDLINRQMIRAMSEVGQRFQDGKAFVPQLLMAGRAMKAALEQLKPMMAGAASTSLGKVVIGTVKGDLHDIGKNLVASMLEGCGFEVVNIGIDVSADTFIKAVKDNQPDILCMSALLTTTMGYMKEVIDALEAAGIRDQVKVMVGGAPVTQGFADEIGADGYSDNANSAVTVAKQLLGKL